MVEPLRPGGHTLLFIAGLHRSGTTQLHNSLATHPAVSGFLATGAPHNEGQHLQDVVPTARAHGGPGRFAFDPAAHLTETSPLATPDAARRLFDQWSDYWDLDRPVLLEKSPPTLVRMRFFQALFPEARFLVIVRHPVTTALATVKLATTPLMRRTRRRPELAAIIEHWFTAHRIALADLAHVRSAHVIRWEDLRDRTDEVLAGVAAFAGIEDRIERPFLDRAVDERYLARWCELARSPRHRDVVEQALSFEEEAQRFGYSMGDPSALQPLRLERGTGGTAGGPR